MKIYLILPTIVCQIWLRWLLAKTFLLPQRSIWLRPQVMTLVGIQCHHIHPMKIILKEMGWIWTNGMTVCLLAQIQYQKTKTLGNAQLQCQGLVRCGKVWIGTIFYFLLSHNLAGGLLKSAQNKQKRTAE